MKGNNTRRQDLLKAKDWFKQLMEGARKGMPQFEAVSKETTFEVRIIGDGKGIYFEADVNFVPEIEDEDVVVEEIRRDEDVEAAFKERVKKALKATNGNLKQAADLLGISKRSLKQRLAFWNL